MALARPHLTNPNFTLAASAYYGYEAQRWPEPYATAKEQAFRLSARERAETEQLREAVKPQSHRRDAAELVAPMARDRETGPRETR